MSRVLFLLAATLMMSGCPKAPEEPKRPELPDASIEGGDTSLPEASDVVGEQ